MEVTETEEEGVTEVSTGMYYKNLLTLWTLNVPLTSLHSSALISFYLFVLETKSNKS